MTAKKRSSRILEAVHETARGLHEVGLIDDQRMAEFDALCRRNAIDPRQCDDGGKASHAEITAGPSSGTGHPAK